MTKSDRFIVVYVGIGFCQGVVVMRMARVKLNGVAAVYHCISRVVGGQMLLDDVCKEKLVEILGKLADFCAGADTRRPPLHVPPPR